MNVNKLKIGPRILLGIGIFSLIPIAILSFISYKSIDNVLDVEINRYIDTKGLAISESVNQWFIGKKSEIEAFTMAPVLLKGAGERERAEFTAANIHRLKSGTKNIYDAQWSTDAAGNFIFAVPTDTGSVKKIVKGTIKDRQYWKPLRSGKTVVSRPIISRSTGKPAVVIAAPIRNEKGIVTGSVGNNILLTFIEEIFKKNALSENSFAVLTSADGTFIIHPDTSYVMKKTLLSADDLLSKQIIKTKDSEQKRGSVTYRGRDKIVACYPVESAGWLVTIVADYDDFFYGKSQLLFKILALFIIVLICNGVMAFGLIRNITTPINNIKEVFLKAGEGDLSNRISIANNDELGDLSNGFNEMMDKMSKLIKKVQHSVESVSESSRFLSGMTDQTGAATDEIAQTIHEISLRADEQANDIEKGVSEIHDLSSIIEQVGSSSENVIEIAHNASALSEKGLFVVNQLNEKSRLRGDAARRVNDMINEVDKSSQEIGIITDTLGDIAEQTNMLSLNAAIEAARAGEYGRGFAVVADEVRSLVEQSSRAANQVKDHIGKIQESSRQAVHAMDNANNAASDQERAVRENENLFRNINESIGNILGKIDEIGKYTETMVSEKMKIVTVMENILTASKDTTRSTKEISASTEEQLSIIEELTAYSRELQELALSLKEQADMFRL